MAKNTHPTIHLFPPRKNIRPGNDFYKHINGNWIRHAHMPSFITSYSVSEEIEDSVAKELFTQIELSVKSLKEGKSLSKEETQIGTLALSCLQNPYQSHSLDFLKTLIDKLGCIRDTDDVASSLGDFLKYRINTVLSIFAGPDTTHSTNMYLCIGSGSIGLPDISYYKATAPGKMRTLLSYISLLRRLGKDFDIPNLELLASLESTCIQPLIKSYGDSEVLMTGSEIASKYKAIPWNIIFEASLDFTPSEWANKKFLVLSKSWLQYLNKLFKTMTLGEWKIWLAGNVILHSLSVLPPPYNDMYFELFKHILQGQSERIPQKNFALYLCQQWLPVSLGKIFEDCCLNKDSVRHAKILAKNIQEAAINRIRNLEWLDIGTRKKGISKVKHIHIGIGVPEKWPDSVEPDLTRNNLLQNILKLGEVRTLNDIQLVKHNLNPDSWDDPSFAVNAYYYNEGNRLIIPGGILRFPFFDKKRSEGWNYGGLGTAMGHELTHAFDVDGKGYNEVGNAISWWLPKDNRAYNAKTRAIINLYEKAKYQGHSVNGALTLSENIADLGGVAVSLGALEEVLAKKNVSKEEKKQQYIDFFTSYAVSWRIKEKKAKSLQGLIMDHHAPAPLRVNLIVSQFQQWYDAFGVTENDVLYIPPEERISIF